MVTEEVIGQGLFSIPLVHIMEYAKAKGWFGDNQYTRGLMVLSSVTYALVTSLGVHLHIEGTWAAGFHFNGTIPPLDVMIEGFEHFLASFGPQQGYYMVVKGIRLLSLSSKLLDSDEVKTFVHNLSQLSEAATPKH